MAVKSVWGHVNNGVDVSFESIGNDQWKVSVPNETSTGYYIAEIWAEDDAGNIAYMIAKLWLIDGSVTCIEWIMDKWNMSYKRDAYTIDYVCPCTGEC